LYSKPMVSALYKRIFLPYQAILSFIVRVHIFVADIHLRPDSKEEAARFISWLSRRLQDADEIYILGDLFDYWYSGIETRFKDVLEALRSPKVHLLPGNRDFLLNNSRQKGIDIILVEETVITINGSRILLAHGHTLTEGDTGFKLLHRYGWPLLEHLDHLFPLSLKDRCACSLVKSSAVVRSSLSNIREGIHTEKGVDTVICGHLHRYITQPGLIVLPAFYDSGAWLEWDKSGSRLCASDKGDHL
jgi:UDP-2,3-diacylglucosamine hydrolase